MVGQIHHSIFDGGRQGLFGKIKILFIIFVGYNEGEPPAPRRRAPLFPAYFVIFSCLTLWSMTWREASSLWMSSREMPIWIMSTMVW